MVIGVKGWNGHFNNSVDTVGALAIMAAISKNGKTLCLQFTGKGNDNIENVILGRKFESGYEMEDTGISDSGMDAILMIASNSGDMKQTDIDDHTFGVFEKHKNLLDIAFASEKTDLLSSIQEEGFKELLKKIFVAASKTYDYIFVLIPPEKNRITDMICSTVDKVVLCIKQSKPSATAEAYYEQNEKGIQSLKTVVAVPRYDKDSMFRERVIKKAVKMPVYGIPFTTNYYDAVESGALLNYIRRNKNIEESDVNYPWLAGIQKLIKNLIDADDVEEEMEAPIGNKKMAVKYEKNQMREISDFQKKKEVEKKGFFGSVEHDMLQVAFNGKEKSYDEIPGGDEKAQGE